MNAMEFVHRVILVLHLLGMAAVVGSYLTVLRSPRLTPGMVHGALTQLVTGLVMVGLVESGATPDEGPIDNAKIGVKLGVALVVVVLAWVNRRRDDVPGGVVHVVGVLAVLNVLVAVLWT